MIVQYLSNVRSRQVDSNGGNIGRGAESLVFSSADISRPKVLACDFGQKKHT